MIYLMRRMDVARCCFALQVPFNERAVVTVPHHALHSSCWSLSRSLGLSRSLSLSFSLTLTSVPSSQCHTTPSTRPAGLSRSLSFSRSLSLSFSLSLVLSLTLTSVPSSQCHTTPSTRPAGLSRNQALSRWRSRGGGALMETVPCDTRKWSGCFLLPRPDNQSVFRDCFTILLRHLNDLFYYIRDIYMTYFTTLETFMTYFTILDIYMNFCHSVVTFLVSQKTEKRVSRSATC